MKQDKVSMLVNKDSLDICDLNNDNNNKNGGIMQDINNNNNARMNDSMIESKSESLASKLEKDSKQLMLEAAQHIEKINNVITKDGSMDDKDDRRNDNSKDYENMNENIIKAVYEKKKESDTWTSDVSTLSYESEIEMIQNVMKLEFGENMDASFRFYCKKYPKIYGIPTDLATLYGMSLYVCVCVCVCIGHVVCCFWGFVFFGGVCWIPNLEIKCLIGKSFI